MKTVIRFVRLNIQLFILLWLDELRIRMNKRCKGCRVSVPVDHTTKINTVHLVFHRRKTHHRIQHPWTIYITTHRKVMCLICPCCCCTVVVVTYHGTSTMDHEPWKFHIFNEAIEMKRSWPLLLAVEFL